MKTKIFILSLCTLTLAACNEPGNPLDKNELVKDAAAISEKSYPEVLDYLASKDYAVWSSSEPTEENWGHFNYCKPKEMAQLSPSGLLDAFQNDSYELMEFSSTYEGDIPYVYAVQQSPTDTLAFKTFLSWYKYMDNLMDNTTCWFAIIMKYSSSYQKEEYHYYDGYEYPNVAVYKKQAEEMGISIGTRKDFDKDVKELTLDRIKYVTVQLEKIKEQSDTMDVISAWYDPVEREDYVPTDSGYYYRPVYLSPKCRRINFRIQKNLKVNL